MRAASPHYASILTCIAEITRPDCAGTLASLRPDEGAALRDENRRIIRA